MGSRELVVGNADGSGRKVWIKAVFRVAGDVYARPRQTEKDVVADDADVQAKDMSLIGRWDEVV